MDPHAALARIVALGPRPACSDGERRVACFAREELRTLGYDARIETFWLRGTSAYGYAIHVALAIVASLLCVSDPDAGLILLAVVTASLTGELTGHWRVLSRLAPEHATQNVVATTPAASESAHLIITAELDAPRRGLLNAKGIAGSFLPSPMAGVWGATVLLCVVAGLRLDGRHSTALGVFQFALTLALIVAFAVSLDLMLARVSTQSNADASGSALALALALAAQLHDSPFSVSVVLAGAGQGKPRGFEQYLRAHRSELAPEQVIVLALGPCLSGTPGWLERDGQLLPLRLHPRLCELMASIAQDGARGRKAWGYSAAYAARRRRLPAIAVSAGGADTTTDALTQTLTLCHAFTTALARDLAA